jgi:FkbM family methyltransferase
MARRGSLLSIVSGTGAAVLFGIVTAIGARYLVQRHQLSVTSLEAELGPKRYSEENEELLIRHFFHDRKFGVFVDVGAGHYERGSNTYFLEKELGWRGLAVDADNQYAAGYTEHRPNTQFVAAFVSNVSDEEADFFVAPRDRTRSSGVAAALDGAGPIIATKVHTITLNDLLRSNSFTRFDFMSMDIELGEPKALAGLDLARFHPALVCIEAHEPVRDAISSYFSKQNYRRLDEYLSVDRRNWYFTPR